MTEEIAVIADIAEIEKKTLPRITRMTADRNH
jgi:hypothetical protein